MRTPLTPSEIDEVKAIEANGGADLPHRDDDPIMRLSAHYFEPAEFMFEEFVRLDKQAKTDKGLSRRRVMERRYYMMYWLSSLYVTVEAIEEMPLITELEKRPLGIPKIADRVVDLIAHVSAHKDSLRLLRNAVFHFQPTAKKNIQFFENGNRLTWAIEIHKMIQKIMSEYRVECTVIYAIAHRRSEMDIKKVMHPSRHYSWVKS